MICQFDHRKCIAKSASPTERKREKKSNELNTIVKIGRLHKRDYRKQNNYFFIQRHHSKTSSTSSVSHLADCKLLTYYCVNDERARVSVQK